MSQVASCSRAAIKGFSQHWKPVAGAAGMLGIFEYEGTKVNMLLQQS